MSRICVKNIPSYITEERLKEHFSVQGEITDVKIMRTRDGRSRKFAFVGYRTEAEAAAALRFFDRSFIDTSRLTCEIARPIGEQTEIRPWSRHSKGSSAYDKIHNVLDNEETCDGLMSDKKSTTNVERQNEDPELIEFLQIMQPRSKAKLWENDANVNKHFVEPKKTHSKLRDLKKNETKTNIIKSLEENKSIISDNGANQVSEDKHKKKEIVAKIAVAQNDHVADEKISDLDYLKQRVKEDWSDDEDNDAVNTSSEIHGAESEIESDNEDGNENDILEDREAFPSENTKGQVSLEDLTTSTDGKNSHPEEVIADHQESVSETGRLFVRNLSYTTSEEDLKDLFGQFGELSEVHLVLDKDTKRSKGFAYILFMLPESAPRAMETLDMSTFQGRLIHILPAKRPPSVPQMDLKINTNTPGTNQFKLEKEAQRKASEAGGSTRAWNSLFMRQDTIAENVARRYGLSKSDLLNPEAGDLAVRMALGETQIITETKKALSDEGIDIEILEGLASGKVEKIKRSNNVILVKNLPYETSQADLVAMFGKFGSLERIILPPTKTLALVIYLEGSEARAAFKGLAYKRFKHVPLYLEWAPENLISKTADRKVDKGPVIAIGSDQVKRAVVEEQLIASTDDIDAVESRSVFIKNLNFSTSQLALKQHIQKNMTFGSLRSVVIKMKQQKSGKLLSMGFGFAEFDKPDTARAVCKQLQGTVLDGHALVMQLSRVRDKPTESSLEKSSSNNGSSTKLIVRNVAFEATKKDLQQLFSPFGQIKSLRLPRKFDGRHRGFAFLEFLTKQEASNAYNALASTHLYGRHLVIERAKEGESLEELRARTAIQFSEEPEGHMRPSKKLKNSLLDDTII